MDELIKLYAFTIVAVAISAGALALIGSQIAARHSAIQSLVISQSSAFGVAVAVAIQPILKTTQGDVADHPLFSYLAGFAITLGVYGLCSAIIAGRVVARNTFYIGIFAVLTALTYLMTAITPALEAHVVANFFGDPSFISHGEAQGIAALGLVVILFTLWQWRRISAWSFQIATFATPPLDPRLINVQFGFNALVVLMLYTSVLLMGLLFTLSALLLPTILLAGATHRNLVFKIAIVPLAMLGTTGGFMFSLWQGTLPTTPCMTLGLVVVGILFAAVLALSMRTLGGVKPMKLFSSRSISR